MSRCCSAGRRFTLPSDCRSDRVRLCPDVAPGHGRILACLTAHPDQLSPMCAAGMAWAGDALISVGQALGSADMGKAKQE
jgi:hypothetical protein